MGTQWLDYRYNGGTVVPSKGIKDLPYEIAASNHLLGLQGGLTTW